MFILSSSLKSFFTEKSSAFFQQVQKKFEFQMYLLKDSIINYKVAVICDRENGFYKYILGVAIIRVGMDQPFGWLLRS